MLATITNGMGYGLKVGKTYLRIHLPQWLPLASAKVGPLIVNSTI